MGGRMVVNVLADRMVVDMAIRVAGIEVEAVLGVPLGVPDEVRRLGIDGKGIYYFIEFIF